MSYFYPPTLNKGDTIGLITPSHYLQDQRRDWVRDGIPKIQELGFKVKEGRTLWAKDKYAVSAGTIEERVEDFHVMLKDPEVNAIWFSQGGDTSNQLLSLLDFSLFTKYPKVILGLSDVTVLLNAILAKSGLITFYGSDPKLPKESWYLNSDYTLGEFERVLCKGTQGAVPAQGPRKMIRKGYAEGHFVGGNFQCFRKLFGTPYMPNLDDAILILEGLSTNIEEAMTVLAHYQTCDLFDKIAGLVLGDFYAFDREGQFDVNGERVWFEDLVLEASRGGLFPILKTSDFGHRLGNTFVPLGGLGFVDAGKGEWGVC